MITASPAWKDIQQRFILPEGFLEITCAITEEGVQDDVSATATNEAFFSNLENAIETSVFTDGGKHATNELNFWSLDGSFSIMPGSAPYDNGYVGDTDGQGSVTLTLPEVHTEPIPGVTITWANEYGEYPRVFTVTAKNGSTVVAETTITDNNDVVSLVDLELANYDSVTITVWEWCLPYRRVRIDRAALGHILTLNKGDILKYTHEQYGELNSGELPKNSVTFSLDNIDGRWNPSNPVGMERYLSERQKVTVRYGMDVNGTIEWIDAGVFYLSEWRAPSNGLEATFVARDVFEYLLNTPYIGRMSGTLREFVDDAFEIADIPPDVKLALSDHLAEYSTTIPDDIMDEYTCAEIVQMCANAASCVIWQDRSGTLHIERLNSEDSGYLVPAALAYSHPEVELSKQLKSVSVSYGENLSYVLSVGAAGETQTVSNPLVSNEAQAAEIAAWVRDTLESRRSVSGEYRADPRLDLFDVVTVESKYGVIAPVAITDIKYIYNGAFAGSYTGRVISKEGYLARSGN